MSYFRKTVEAMQAYVPGEQPAPGAPVIKLNTNENPYPPSPKVVRAIADELSGEGSRLRLYSDPWAQALRNAASLAYGVPSEQILHGNGSDELLSMIVRALVEPGEIIAYPYPTYVLYETLADAHGAKIVRVNFDADFTLPHQLCEVGAKVVFVASPNSPSGNRHDNEVLRKLARALQGGVLVIDEAYADFASGNALQLVTTEPNVLVLRTFSKSYSLAGMRLGLLFGSKELIAGIGKIKDSYNLDRLAIAAGTAALGDPSWMRANVERIQQTRERLVKGLQALGLAVLPSEANFVFARLHSPERAARVYDHLKQQGVLVRYFRLPLLDDGLRITVGTEEEIDVLLQALQNAPS